MSLVTNHKASFNYEFIETYHAGVELFGFEVKALQKGLGSLEGSRVTVRGGEAFVVGMFVPPYQVGNTPPDYDPYRNRKLLLNKNEIIALGKAESTKGLTIVPISVYNKGKKIKTDIVVAKGKKKYDKREVLKKKDSARDVARDFKDR